MNKVDLSVYSNNLGLKHKMKRVLWGGTWLLLARPLPRKLGRRWKIILINIFGGNVSKKATVYSSVKIYAPWNLEMHDFSCLAPEVDCYNVDRIIIGAHSTVSQKSYLCTASHDVTKSSNPLTTAPIIIKDQVWIGADVYLGMGVTVEQGSVVGARSSVYKDVKSWEIIGGNPAKFIKKRKIIE